MTYRPDNWDHIRSVWLEQNYTTGKMKQKTFEAGADAMIEELKKEAIHIREKKGWEYLKDSYEVWLHGDEVGYIIFIPEEK